MTLRDQIEAKVQAALTPSHLEVLDESANHSRGQETHFKVTVVAESFRGQRLLARHRTLNALLAAELAGGVHALALHTLTPDEWVQSGAAPASPDCAHTKH